MNELKPCPFCGAAPHEYKDGTQDLTCMTEGCPTYNFVGSPQDWNKRAAPVVERQESMTRFNIYASTHHTTSWGEPCVVAELHVKQDLEGEWARFKDIPPPAAVSVVVPERFAHEHSGCFLSERQHGWNACLDKVKELNQ